jgi:hypothetical protein
MARGETTKSDDRVRRAAALLAEAAQERLRRHPQGHLAAGAREGLELTVTIPLSPDGSEIDRAADTLTEGMARGIDGLIHHRAYFRPGHVYCLRCGGSECEHSKLPSERSTFAGYGPSGVPRFLDFPQWLMERGDPRAASLYGEDGPRRLDRVVAVATPGEELTSALLDVYRDRSADYRLHGQVTAGWFRATDTRGHGTPLAVTFQVVSSRPPGNRRRLGLNVLAQGPDGEPAEHLYDRLGAIPWSIEVRWAQTVLTSIERTLSRKGSGRKKGKKKGAKPGAAPGESAAQEREKTLAHAEARIQGLLEGLARRLEKGRRAQERRTRHAEERHDQGDRPTRMALTDLAQAKDEDVLLDTRERTFVVLGDRGRAHVFNRQGKIVTSVRYSTEAIEKRRTGGRWKPLPKDEVAALRVMVGGAQSG